MLHTLHWWTWKRRLLTPLFTAATKGEVLDLSLLTMEPGSEGETLAAVLSKQDNKTIVTLFQMPNSIVEKGGYAL